MVRFTFARASLMAIAAAGFAATAAGALADTLGRSSCRHHSAIVKIAAIPTTIRALVLVTGAKPGRAGKNS